MRTIEEIKADISKCNKCAELLALKPCPLKGCLTCVNIPSYRIKDFVLELVQTVTKGIPLDRLTEICNAERLIGRTVYLICKFMGGYTFVDCTVIRAELTDDNVFIWVQNITEGIDEYKVSINMIGKTVFFTKEEAEQALKGGELK